MSETGSQEQTAPSGAMADRVPALVSYWDADMRNRTASGSFLEMLGRSPEEIEGRHASEVLGAELFALNRPYFERALEGEPQLFERTISDADGARRDTRVTYTPHILDGEVRGCFVVVTDVTARRIAERARAAAETRFELAFTRSPVGMSVMDRSERMLAVNPALCEMLGDTEQELRERPFAELLSREHRERERRRIARLFSGEAAPASAECRLRRRDGNAIWAILSLALADAEDDGEAIAIAHVQDISTRKQAEDELRRSRERLAEAEQIAQIGSWDWDMATDRTIWSDGLQHIYGLTPDQIEPGLTGAEQRIYPPDRALVTRTLEHAMAQRSPFTVEYRAMRSDGRVRTLRSRGEVIVDDDGEPIRLVGVVQDITDAKLAEDALRSTSADLERHASELQQLALRSVSERSTVPRAALTARQLEILRLIAQGLTNAAIAERLVVTEGTVKWHVKQILAKTGAANRAEAVARVLRDRE